MLRVGVKERSILIKKEIYCVKGLYFRDKGFLCAIRESKVDKKLRVLEGARNMRAKSAEKLREENISICNN